LLLSPIFPFAVYGLTPQYLSDRIVLFDGTPTLTYDESAGNYFASYEGLVNFNPQTDKTKYYFIVESYNVQLPVMWMLSFKEDGLGEGVGAWITPTQTKFSGIEIAGYTLIPWTWHKTGSHNMVLRFRCNSPSVTGLIKVYIKWFEPETEPPPPEYTITVENVECAGLNKPIIVSGKISPAVGMKQVGVTITYPSGKTQTLYQYTSSNGTFKIESGFVATEVGEYTVQAFVDNVKSPSKTFTVTTEGIETGRPKPTLATVFGAIIATVGLVLIVYPSKTPA